MSSTDMPDAYSPPTSAPMLVPAMQSTGMCSSSIMRSTLMCAMPRAPPPPSARPMRGRVSPGSRVPHEAFAGIAEVAQRAPVEAPAVRAREVRPTTTSTALRSNLRAACASGLLRPGLRRGLGRWYRPTGSACRAYFYWNACRALPRFAVSGPNSPCPPCTRPTNSSTWRASRLRLLRLLRARGLVAARGTTARDHARRRADRRAIGGIAIGDFADHRACGRAAHGAP